MKQFLTWVPEYSVHSTVIDSQRQKIFDIANQYYAAARFRDHSAVRKSLDTYLRCLDEHFSFEEKFLKERGSPGLTTHFAEHGKLLDDARQFHKQLCRVEDKLTGFFFDHMVCRLIIHHMMGSDLVFRTLTRAGAASP